MTRHRNDAQARERRQQRARIRPRRISPAEAAWYAQAIAHDGGGVVGHAAGLSSPGTRERSSLIPGGRFESGPPSTQPVRNPHQFAICAGHGAFLCRVGYGHVCLPEVE
jgi:hypothetical protein